MTPGRPTGPSGVGELAGLHPVCSAPRALLASHCAAGLARGRRRGGLAAEVSVSG